MSSMTRAIRTLAAVLAGLALAAALPAPCGCAPGRTGPAPITGHECCAPPAGVRAADEGCCDETPVLADALPSPAGPVGPPIVIAVIRVEAPSTLRVLVRPSTLLTSSPPSTVRRI
jgi:hypothetical protein